jgi:hypothetical protein
LCAVPAFRFSLSRCPSFLPGPFFEYALNLPTGDYAISLYFADANSTFAGQRTFDVLFDEVKVLSALDIYATIGNNALIVTKAATVVSELLTVSFVGLNNTAALVAALKVAPINVNGTLPSFALDVGSPNATLSETGVLYQADNETYFLPGGAGNITTAAPGSNLTLGGLPTNDSYYTPALFRTARVGNLTLSIPLPNGDYLVDLHFADVNDTSAGQRVFNVTLNGQPALTNFDLAATYVRILSNGTEGPAAVKDTVFGNGTGIMSTVFTVQVSQHGVLKVCFFRGFWVGLVVGIGPILALGNDWDGHQGRG